MPHSRRTVRPFRFVVELLEDREAPSDTLNAILGSLYLGDLPLPATPAAGDLLTPPPIIV